MAYKLVEIKGIGESYSANLQENLGFKTVEELLEAGASKKGREELAEKTGISEKLILRWVNMADLFRIKGVAEDFSDLLEAAGVDTIKELRHRVPANLHAKLVEVNDAQSIAGRTPRLDEVESWIEQAKEMEPTVTH
jgi:predicted flap endonuclease-1-like 5' DNA nuclease